MKIFDAQQQQQQQQQTESKENYASKKQDLAISNSEPIRGKP